MKSKINMCTREKQNKYVYAEKQNKYVYPVKSKINMCTL